MRNAQFGLKEADARWRTDIERRLAALERSPRLPDTSIGAGGLTVRDDGAVRVQDAAGITRATLNTTGLALLADSGDLVTVGPLHIETADDLEIVSAADDTSPRVAATANVTVPNGYDSATAIVFGECQGYNAGSGGNMLRAFADVGASRSGFMGHVIPAGYTGTVPASHTHTVTGLTGGDTITVAVGFQWDFATPPPNDADMEIVGRMNAIVLFT